MTFLSFLRFAFLYVGIFLNILYITLICHILAHYVMVRGMCKITILLLEDCLFWIGKKIIQNITVSMIINI